MSGCWPLFSRIDLIIFQNVNCMSKKEKTSWRHQFSFFSGPEKGFTFFCMYYCFLVGTKSNLYSGKFSETEEC